MRNVYASLILTLTLALTLTLTLTLTRNVYASYPEPWRVQVRGGG